MEARAKLFGHPIHQMLIVFPLGLLATSIAFDVVRVASGNDYWGEIAYWLIAAGNVVVLLLFAGSWWLRRDDPRTPETMALTLSAAGALLSLVTGWLGGELVDRLGVGVDERRG